MTHRTLTFLSFLKTLCMTLLMSVCIISAHAPAASAQSGNLFVSPQRLTLDDMKKTDQLHLVNKSDEVKSYEITLKNYAMDTNGTLGKEVDTMPYSSKEFLRFSPRRITLKPGEEQFIRVMLRLPPNTELGGYHSHIEFNEIENAANRASKKDKEKKDAQVSFRVGASYGVAIPVFVNVGDTTGTLKINNIKADIKNGTDSGKAMIVVDRSGNASVQKQLTVYYIDQGGTAHIAMTPANVSIYREVDQISREFQLKLPEGVVFASGSLRVTLSDIGQADNQQKLDEKTISIP